eukprot:1160527-Pelagomonas_calceolata.AAC.4
MIPAAAGSSGCSLPSHAVLLDSRLVLWLTEEVQSFTSPLSMPTGTEGPEQCPGEGLARRPRHGCLKYGSYIMLTDLEDSMQQLFRQVPMKVGTRRLNGCNGETHVGSPMYASKVQLSQHCPDAQARTTTLNLIPETLATNTNYLMPAMPWLMLRHV